MVVTRIGNINGAESAPTQQDKADALKTAGQRRINVVWEVTQALIAVSFTGAYIYASVSGIDSPGMANATFLIVGFYFSRTNHQRVGGVGGDSAGTR